MQAISPVMLGYAFMGAGVLLGAIAFKKGFTSPSGLARNPFSALFLTGMWLGLLLGGLGLVFHGSFVSGLITAAILILAGVLGMRRLSKRDGM